MKNNKHERNTGLHRKLTLFLMICIVVFGLLPILVMNFFPDVDSSNIGTSLLRRKIIFSTHSIIIPQESKPLKEILKNSGVDVTEAIQNQLPPISEANSMYGSPVVLYGLNRCEEFRNSVKSEDRYIGAAGMFNTGTNLLSEYLQKNCHMPHNKDKRSLQVQGIRWQVPWGKHSPVSLRGINVAATETRRKHGIVKNQTHVFPVVVIKDPFFWMSSMCRHPYSAIWKRSSNCPNLVPKAYNMKFVEGPSGVNVKVQYADKERKYTSLAHLWNEWYADWVDVKFPRIIIRYEDLLFHPETVLEKICTCAGGLMNDKFTFVGKSAKEGGSHLGSSGLVKALTTYASSTMRLQPFEDPDIEYALSNIRTDIMDEFHYSVPEFQ